MQNLKQMCASCKHKNVCLILRRAESGEKHAINMVQKDYTDVDGDIDIVASFQMAVVSCMHFSPIVQQKMTAEDITPGGQGGVKDEQASDTTSN